jgi:hypothetical protein
MNKTARSMVAIPVAVILAGLPGLPGLPLSAMAQQPTDQPSPKKPAVRGRPTGPQNPPGQPPHPGGGPARAAQIRAPGRLGGEHGPAQPAPFDGLGQPGQVHAVHAAGERGYSFRGADHGRRDVATFNERERAVWLGSHWRHERRFGRLGYWWEVNGVWYYYDQRLAGPPTYVSEVEFMDKGLDRGAPVVVGQRPAPAPGSQCPTGSKSYLVRPFVHVEGYAFKASAASLVPIADTDRELYRSPAVLCEDGIRMGPEHSFWAAIVKSGLGRFSHYGDMAVFSSTDNSDPNVNGRQYTIVVPAP